MLKRPAQSFTLCFQKCVKHSVRTAVNQNFKIIREKLATRFQHDFTERRPKTLKLNWKTVVVVGYVKRIENTVFLSQDFLFFTWFLVFKLCWKRWTLPSFHHVYAYMSLCLYVYSMCLSLWSTLMWNRLLYKLNKLETEDLICI